jgi:hypothetical protein
MWRITCRDDAGRVVPLRNSAYDEAGQRFMADACRAGRDASGRQTVTNVGGDYSEAS